MSLWHVIQGLSWRGAFCLHCRRCLPFQMQRHPAKWSWVLRWQCLGGFNGIWKYGKDQLRKSILEMDVSSSFLVYLHRYHHWFSPQDWGVVISMFDYQSGYVLWVDQWLARTRLVETCQGNPWWSFLMSLPNNRALNSFKSIQIYYGCHPMRSLCLMPQWDPKWL